SQFPTAGHELEAAQLPEVRPPRSAVRVHPAPLSGVRWRKRARVDGDEDVEEAPLPGFTQPRAPEVDQRLASRERIPTVSEKLHPGVRDREPARDVRDGAGAAQLAEVGAPGPAALRYACEERAL